SLIENAAIENVHLEKIASKSFNDFYALIDYVTTGTDQLPTLEGNYQKQEIDDCIAVLKDILKIRNIVVKVNENYIQSAAIQDNCRPGPALKLPGSERSMSRLVAQVVPVMNDQERQQLSMWRYVNESQTLAADTESNRLELKELAGLLSD